jgi:hypothetical protein
MYPAIDRHFAGAISVGDERAMRAHVTVCDRCRDYYRRHAVAEIAVGGLGAQRRLAVGLGLRARRLPRWLAPAMLAATACVAIVAWRLAAVPVMAERGGRTDDIAGFRVRDQLPLSRAREIARADELSFAYRASGDHRYLAVFARDDAGHVYWYFPAWTDPHSVPAAVPIRAAGDLVELPEAVRHDVAGTRLWIYAAFVDRPWTTLEIEAQLAGSAPGAPVMVERVVAPRYQLEVTR